MLVDAFTGEIDELSDSIAELFRDHAGYHAIQQLPGVGPILAAIFVAEIGDVHRFASAAHLASWCGVTPRHRESDTTVRRGPITKQGSKLVRWAAIEAAQKLRRDSWLYAERERLAERRNSRSIAKTAIARKLDHPHLLRPARRQHPLPRASRMTPRSRSPIRMRTRCLS